jgi:hypothetical protein
MAMPPDYDPLPAMPNLLPPHPRGYVCARVREPFPIDGDLTKSVWQGAPWSEPFVDIEGDKRPTPRFRTRVKMLWDDRFFYIGAEMEEPHVWATLTRHDSVIFHDNDFEVFLDPDGDNHEYYELEINALNTTWDLRLPKPYRDGGPALNEWEIPGMRTAVRVLGTLNDPSDTDTGWTLEIALPWSVLGVHAGCPAPPRPGEQWRINFSRVEWDIEVRDGKYCKIPNRPEHNWVWSPQGVVDMHQPERWGYVQFAERADEPFRPDAAWDERCRLMRAYHAQKAFHRRHGRWAERWDELGNDGAAARTAGLTLRRTGDGWEAFLSRGGTLVVRQDSRLRKRR